MDEYWFNYYKNSSGKIFKGGYCGNEQEFEDSAVRVESCCDLKRAYRVHVVLKEFSNA